MGAEPHFPRLEWFPTEDQSRGREDSGHRHLIFAHDILRDRGLGISAGTSASFIVEDFTNRLAFGKGSCCASDETHSDTLSQHGKQLQMQAKSTGSGVVHLHWATSDDKTNGAVLERDSPLHFMLITMLLTSGPESFMRTDRK